MSDDADERDWRQMDEPPTEGPTPPDDNGWEANSKYDEGIEIWALI